MDEIQSPRQPCLLSIQRRYTAHDIFSEGLIAV